MEGLAFNSGQVHSNGQVTIGDDGKIWAEFYPRPVLDVEATKLEGRQIYKDEDYVKIRQPGERDEFCGRATEEFQLRFPKQWALYQAKMDQKGVGTPLNLLFVTEPHVIKQCEPLHVFTVEQLAGLSENGISRLGMGGRAQVLRAKEYLETAKRGAPAHEVNAKMEAMDAEIQSLKGQLQQALAALADKGKDNGKRN